MTGVQTCALPIFSVADDGGSTGRLRRDLGVLGVGDLRKCLAALAAAEADAPIWAAAFEHRFDTGELEGHALGNLILVGLAVGIANGVITTRFRINSLIATLAVSFVVGGLAALVVVDPVDRRQGIIRSDVLDLFGHLCSL